MPDTRTPAEELAIAEQCDAKGDHDNAIDALARATQLGDIEATTRLGKRLITGENSPLLPIQGAGFLIEAFNKGGAEAAARLDPQNAKYHNNLGLAYARKGSYDLAFAEFKMAGNEAQANYNMARLYRRAGQHAKARIHMAEASNSDSAVQKPRTNRAGSNNLAAVTMLQSARQANHNLKTDMKGMNPDHLKDQIQEENTPEISIAELDESIKFRYSSYSIIEDQPKFDTARNPSRRKVLANPEIEVSNGNGINRMAARIGKYLQKTGLKVTRLTNAEHFNFPITTIFYRDEYLQDAFNVATHIPGYQNMEEVAQINPQNIKVKVLIGKDLIGYDRFFRYQLKRNSSVTISKKF